jgi:hypothetical protein
LIELSIIIIVLFAFLSLLFVGATAWKRGSDRAGCIVNLRQVQLAIRGHANINRLDVGDTIVNGHNAIIGSDKFLSALPECPAQGAYSFSGNQVPAYGTLFMSCSLNTLQNHEPELYDSW